MHLSRLLFIVAFLLSAPMVEAQYWYTPLNFGLLPSTPSMRIRYDDVFFLNRDVGVLVSSYGIIFKTYDGAAHWEVKKVAGPVYFRSVEFTSDGQTGIAGTLSGSVYRSADGGETWDDISANINDTGIVSGRRICGIAHHDNTFYGVGWWGGNSARVYKSDDAGLTWHTSYIDPALATGLVDAVCLSEDTVFITGCREVAGGNRESVILRTVDGGVSWTKVFGDTTIGGRIWKIQFVDKSYGVASIEPLFRDTVAMVKTLDGGNTWQIFGAGKTHAWTYGWGNQGIGFIDRQKGWMGGYYNGMFETNDGGLTWDSIATGQECDRFFLIDSTMYVSANTVYKYGDSTRVTAGIKEPVFMHILSPVLPNPASGTVHISFDIREHKTNTLLEVINVDSRKAYPVTRGYLSPGHYEYTWDGTFAPPGDYIVWLGTDEIPMVQKFVLTGK